MVVDEDKNLAIERIYQSLLIPLASRIYALGMGRRELDLKSATGYRRHNDRVSSFKAWKKYQSIGR